MDTPTSQPYTPTPAPAPVAHSPRSNKGVIAAVVIAVLLIGGYLAWAMSADMWPFAATEPVASESPSPSTNTEPTVGVKTFTSQALGIRFDYVATEGDPVIEVGDKVYVGGKEGQWVQEFMKNPTDDLKAAITKKFLVGIPPNKCPIVVQAVAGRPGIEMGTIGFDFEPTGLDDPRIDASPCPADYRETNGIRYFWMDGAHPGKFFFFSIGQYYIMAEPGTADGLKAWQDTFEVIK